MKKIAGIIFSVFYISDTLTMQIKLNDDIFSGMNSIQKTRYVTETTSLLKSRSELIKKYSVTAKKIKNSVKINKNYYNDKLRDQAGLFFKAENKYWRKSQKINSLKLSNELTLKEFLNQTNQNRMEFFDAIIHKNYELMNLTTELCIDKSKKIPH